MEKFHFLLHMNDILKLDNLLFQKILKTYRTQMFHVDKGQLFDQISQFALAICVFRNVGTHFERFSTNFREVGVENYRTLALSVDLLAI